MKSYLGIILIGLITSNTLITDGNYKIIIEKIKLVLNELKKILKTNNKKLQIFFYFNSH
jgi:hypothetical protein